MKEIAKAIVAAQGSIKSIAKDKRNEFGKFDYSSAEMVVRDVKTVLNANGLALIPVKHEIAKDDDSDLFLFRESWHLIHGKSGEHIEITHSGIFSVEKGKSLSQAQGSAETYVYKNVCRMLGFVPRFKPGEDPDDHVAPRENGSSGYSRSRRTTN